ncbi:MAG TPA: ethanolamine utilization microcompartment protein EutL [Polyangia bacterium]|nr:ethanolamine utilization microcompartment protein EutL [Polyangia bacterium]
MDYCPVRPRALAVRTISEASPDLAASLGLAPDRRALGLITATSDDALFTALDQGTKASPADVVYARSFYAGAAHASGPLSGECIGIYAARDPAEIDAALTACLAYLENEAWFYAIGVGTGGDDVIFFPHVVAATGRYLAPLAGVAAGAPIAYLIAPPLESIIGIDAACKAATVRLTKWFGPPSETNFGGGYLAGDQPACEAAARAFASAIADVCAAPRTARDARGGGEAPSASVARGGNGVRAGATGSAQPARFRALATGERFAIKPDHLTHLVDDTTLVVKTHPRIALRGKIDFLQSAILDAQVAADQEQARGLVGELGELLELARALVGAEVTGKPLAPFRLFGMSPDEVRDATHHTQELYGVPFMYPDVRQGPVIAKLNLARAVAREAELSALAAFPARGPGDDHDHHQVDADADVDSSATTGSPIAPPGRPDLCLALNRISSALYLLACKYVAGRYDGTRRPRGPVRGWRPPR